MNENAKTLIFAGTMAIVCATLLTGVSLMTSERQEANRRAEKISNILGSMDVPVPEDADAEQLVSIFEKEVKVEDHNGQTLYKYTPTPDAPPAAIAIPFEGSGVWGPIKGVIALESDMSTIRSVRIYQQEETPGLGGEISAQWFLKQFTGKSLVGPEKNPGFFVLKPGAATNQNSVEGITGATMTSDALQILLNDFATRVWKEFNTHDK